MIKVYSIPLRMATANSFGIYLIGKTSEYTGISVGNLNLLSRRGLVETLGGGGHQGAPRLFGDHTLYKLALAGALCDAGVPIVSATILINALFGESDSHDTDFAFRINPGAYDWALEDPTALTEDDVYLEIIDGRYVMKVHPEGGRYERAVGDPVCEISKWGRGQEIEVTALPSSFKPFDLDDDGDDRPAIDDRLDKREEFREARQRARVRIIVNLSLSVRVVAARAIADLSKP